MNIINMYKNNIYKSVYKKEKTKILRSFFFHAVQLQRIFLFCFFYTSRNLRRHLVRLQGEGSVLRNTSPHGTRKGRPTTTFKRGCSNCPEFARPKVEGAQRVIGRFPKNNKECRQFCRFLVSQTSFSRLPLLPGPLSSQARWSQYAQFFCFNTLALWVATTLYSLYIIRI